MTKDNEEKANRARHALIRYVDDQPLTRVLEAPDEAALTDLITDAMHLFGRQEVLAAVDRAEMHYAAEIEDEP